MPSFKTRFFDWVPLLADGPQELDIALMRFSCEHPPTSIGLGESLHKDLERWYNWKATLNFKKQLKLLLQWAWIHDGLPGKIFINKAPAFTKRVDLLIELWPKSKFIYIERTIGHIESIEKSIKSFNKEFGFIEYIDDAKEDAKLTRSFILEKWQITKNLIPKNNLIVVNYEDLINKPIKTIENLKTFTGVSDI
ncbi:MULTISPECIES: sulfotransferase family protein [Prochlorococcus]|uniref:sulfotransferase family protein n=1 Tax=Prochlorococcus TaxID=1218 RepID=UPI000AA7E8CC|nr:sulfotransferase [Prochlorococcus marinus]